MSEVIVNDKKISLKEFEELKKKIELENETVKEKKTLRRISEGVYKVLTEYRG